MPRVTRVAAHSLPKTADELVRLYPPLAIHDEVAYRNAMEVIDALTRLPELTRGQLEYLDTLSILVGEYENEHEPFDTSSSGPLGVLRHLMEARDMSASDLGRLLGERSLGSKVLSCQRELSKMHIRKLAKHFNVSTDLFL